MDIILAIFSDGTQHILLTPPSIDTDKPTSNPTTVVDIYFKLSEHFFYKKYLKKSYSIPVWRGLPNKLKVNIKILGELFYTLFELTTTFYNLLDGSSIAVYNNVIDEFKREYLVGDIPNKRQWIIKQDNNRGKLRRYVNPIGDACPYTRQLFELCLRYSQANNTFCKTKWANFQKAYKNWADSIEISTDWYTKIK